MGKMKRMIRPRFDTGVRGASWGVGGADGSHALQAGLAALTTVPVLQLGTYLKEARCMQKSSP